MATAEPAGGAALRPLGAQPCKTSFHQNKSTVLKEAAVASRLAGLVIQASEGPVRTRTGSSDPPQSPRVTGGQRLTPGGGDAALLLTRWASLRLGVRTPTAGLRGQRAHSDRWSPKITAAKRCLFAQGGSGAATCLPGQRSGRPEGEGPTCLLLWEDSGPVWASLTRGRRVHRWRPSRSSIRTSHHH